MKARLLFVHVLSALHPGTGQGVGAIDLPVAREKSTGIPYLPGSSLKGVLREACSDKELTRRVYGPDTDEGAEYAGSIQVSDQRLLLLPVRSLVGTFAWVTSPYILRRLLRDAQAAEIKDVPSGSIPSPAEENRCVVSVEGAAILRDGKVVLEDLDLQGDVAAEARQWAEWMGAQLFPDDEYWRRALVERLCVVHDGVFGFLLETGTEVVARVRLEENKKTVAQGGLWYEEMLPVETVLCGLVSALPVKATVEEVFSTVADAIRKPLHIGGKTTVGRGLCKLTMTGGA
ncbi:MAG TPA: type III-B CRISPR module RAMP protein Cmr4 [Firmicutes bacterium]|nr:type III-B CRISPR module RAMP protein Cmr4 [Bacillota bacterium]